MKIFQLIKPKQGPDLLPIKVRLWIIMPMVLLSLDAIGFKNNLSEQTNAFAISLGVFASGVLYWETVISDEELDQLYFSALREGASGISMEQLSFFALYWIVGGLNLVVLTTLFVSKINHGTHMTLIHIVLIFILIVLVSLLPATLGYFLRT